MKSTLQTLLVLILLAGWVLAAAALHVVRKSDGGVGIVPKNRLGFSETYLDIRTWTPADTKAHAGFSQRLLDTGKTHWLKEVFGSTSDDVSAELREVLAGGPAPATRPTGPTPPATRPGAAAADHSPRFMGVK